METSGAAALPCPTCRWLIAPTDPSQRAADGAGAGQGYIAQALGIADVLAVSYFHALSYRPQTRLGGT